MPDPARVSPPSSPAEAASSAVDPASSAVDLSSSSGGEGAVALARDGSTRLLRGELVGVFRMILPSEMKSKIVATWLPRIRSSISGLLHILQKKFSSRRPTSLERRFLFAL